MTTANLLTLLRLLLVPVFILLVSYGYPTGSLLVFLLAGLTDLLDGLLARTLNQRSQFGMLLDPIADKLLLVSSFLILTAEVAEGTTRIPLWLTITVVSRDVLLVVAVIITNLALGKHVFPPSIWGKLTTAFQLLTVLAVLFSNALRLELPFLQPLFFVTLALTVISTLHYLFSRGMKLSDYQE